MVKGKYSFLVVDDEQDIRGILSDFLQDSFTCDIQTAPSGLAGLDCAKKQRFDVIISDHRMPEMTGAEFINNVRAETGPNQGTPVIFLSGYVEEARAGIKDKEKVLFLDKVLYPTELVPSVEKIVNSL
ncbi:MAG: response regulator [Oligoflexia bacterium]|nr:response regulator [Oligoflexia bacterium]